MSLHLKVSQILAKVSKIWQKKPKCMLPFNTSVQICVYGSLRQGVGGALLLSGGVQVKSGGKKRNVIL